LHAEADEGVSGLTANRQGFKRLFKDWIENPNAPHFDYVLVYDVSRWGRFQNQNEAAYYEHICEKNNKRVIYISQGFPKEEQELSHSIITPMERWMAAQYSKQLSEKVFYGSLNISKQGYSVGGTASYGLARLLLDENKRPVGVLKKGQHKAISNARITFVPANDQTTDIVKQIFDEFVTKWKLPEEIANDLNAYNISSPSGKQWHKETVMRILGNEAYIGTRIYNKTWHKLKQGHRRNPRNEWVVVPNAFPAIVEERVFVEAQQRLYWLVPTRWKKGIYAMRKAERALKQELHKLFLAQGFSEQEEIDEICRVFPILYGVTFSPASNSSCWCFLLPSQMRRYRFVLGVGIAPNREDPIEKVFLIPTKEFGDNDFQILQEGDITYTTYHLTDELQIKEKVIDILKEVKMAAA